MRDDERLRQEPLLIEIASLCVIHDLFKMSSSNSSSLKSSGDLQAMDNRGLAAFG